MREGVRRRLLPALLWISSAALLLALAVGFAMPRARLPGPAQLEGPIGFLYINEGTTDRTRSVSDNVVSGLAAFADGSLVVLPGSPWFTGGRGPSGPVLRRGAAAGNRRAGGVGRPVRGGSGGGRCRGLGVRRRRR